MAAKGITDYNMLRAIHLSESCFFKLSTFPIMKISIKCYNHIHHIKTKRKQKNTQKTLKWHCFLSKVVTLLPLHLPFAHFADQYIARKSTYV